VKARLLQSSEAENKLLTNKWIKTKKARGANKTVDKLRESCVIVVPARKRPSRSRIPKYSHQQNNFSITKEFSKRTPSFSQLATQMSLRMLSCST